MVCADKRYATDSQTLQHHNATSALGHVKGSDAEITYIEALSLDYLHAVGVGEFATHAVVAVHTCMNSLCSIYRQIELLA